MMYLGVDLGTSSVKILLIDEKGTILDRYSAEYPLSYPQPGWAEQDPADWIEAVTEGIKKITASIDKQSIRAIGLGGQMHGLVALDENDCVIRPAILWNDGRTSKEVAYLNETIGTKTIEELTGNIAFAGFTAPKLLWMAENEPENFKRIRKIMLPKDYVNYCLCKSFASDLSDASGTLLLDTAERKWSKQMLEIVGIGEEMLPKLYESYEVIGTLTPLMAKTLGLSESVKIVAGAGDNAAAAVGTGTVGDGSCNLSIGTSGTLFVASDRFISAKNEDSKERSKENALHRFAHANGRYHLMGCMLSAASCNEWFVRRILGSSDYQAEQQAISTEDLGRNPVFFLPYLMGERSPWNDEKARASFIGMSLDTTRADMVQAVMEGVAFGLRDSLEIVRKSDLTIRRSTLCGGGARSKLWQTILANVLNTELMIPQTEEGPGYGAAMLAMVGDGLFSTVEQAGATLCSVKETVKPDPKIVARYEQRYQAFSLLYPALRDVFPKLAKQAPKQ